jgi:hypothetical protein
MGQAGGTEDVVVYGLARIPFLSEWLCGAPVDRVAG